MMGGVRWKDGIGGGGKGIRLRDEGRGDRRVNGRIWRRMRGARR